MDNQPTTAHQGMVEIPLDLLASRLRMPQGTKVLSATADKGSVWIVFDHPSLPESEKETCVLVNEVLGSGGDVTGWDRADEEQPA